MRSSLVAAALCSSEIARPTTASQPGGNSGSNTPALELVSVKRIWNHAHYNSFGDLIRFHDRWFCTCREGELHVARPGTEDNGKIRVISSPDGETWASAAVLEEPGVDLRDSNLSITPDGRLMISTGASRYPGGVYKGRQPRVVFSADGSHWTKPQPVLTEGHWLWRVTWHKERAYGISYYGSQQEFRQDLVESDDGVHWRTVVELKVPDGNEATLRFLPDDRMVVLMRRDGWGRTPPVPPAPDTRFHAQIGVSTPPYRHWEWHTASQMVGGPNFIVLPSGRMVGGGRLLLNEDSKTSPKRTDNSKTSLVPRTGLGFLTSTSLEPKLWLPSGGDNGYPGIVYHDGLLWITYYSGHEGNPALYLAKVRVHE
jgi:hypothetical protein